MAIRRTLAEFSDDIASADIADNAVTTAKIADNQITLAKMAGGTDGQIITYDASGDPVAVGPGTDGQVLTSTGAGSPPAYEALPASNNASALTTGTLAIARMAAGTILQVLHFRTKTSATTTTANTWFDSGCKLSITPSSTSNKILIQGIICAETHHSGTGDIQSSFGITRAITGGSDTQLIGQIEYSAWRGYSTSIIGDFIPMIYLDSPSTTSAIEYEFNGNFKLGASLRFHESSNHYSEMVLMEVAG